MNDLEAQFESSDEVRRLKERVEFLEVRVSNGAEEVPPPPPPTSPPPTKNPTQRPVPIANPSPLGLISFGMVSWLSGVSKIAAFPLIVSGNKSDGVLALTGIFVGGVGQVLAGMISYAKNNMHGATTFSFFGLHWIIQGVLLYGKGTSQFVKQGEEGAVAAYFALLTFVTILLWAPSIKMNRVLCTTLVFVILVFALDAVAAYHIRGAEVAAGAFSCIAATGAFYMCAADLINEVWQRPIIPVFPHDSHKDDYIRLAAYIPKIHFHKSITSGPQV